jgi:hypothetical protein
MLTTEQEAAIRAAIVEHLADEGVTLDPNELRLSSSAPSGVDGLTLFQAEYGAGERRSVHPGTVDSDGEVNTLPNDALVTVWEGWLAAGGFPDPAEVARVSAYLIGDHEHRREVLTESDREGIGNQAERSRVELPRLLDDGTGVVFWTVGRGGAREVTLRLDDDLIRWSERDSKGG